MTAVRCIQIGVGPIGGAIISKLLDQDDLELLAAVDRDPQLVGQTVDPRSTVRVTADLPQGLDADVAIVATSSRLLGTQPIVERCFQAGLHVVSTCEELAYPWVRQPDVATALHQRAVDAGLVVIGGGINPGYLMDALPAMLRWPQTELRAVRVQRAVDTRRRRAPLLRKTGAGLSPGEFAALARTGDIGHVGLIESADLLAAALGSRLIESTIELQPVIAEETLTLPDHVIEAGSVAGQLQVLRARTSTAVDIGLDLTMAATVTTPFDEVHLVGEPDIRWRADGGVDGDVGTVGAILQLARTVGGLEPGLRTMADLSGAGAPAGA